MRMLALLCAVLVLGGCSRAPRPVERLSAERQPSVVEPLSPGALTGTEGIGAGGQADCPKLVHRVPTVYPEKARKRGLSGRVFLKAVVEISGAVGKIDVVSGDPILVPAALEAVRQWRYEVCSFEGTVVPTTIPITVSFTLNQ
ncbi:MAG: energy transducer TonB [Bryobacteraceae bacterium]